MINKEPLKSLPFDIQNDFGADLIQADEEIAFRLIDIRKTNPKGYQSQRITVLVLDENGFPMPMVNVAFSYSTADKFTLTDEWTWNPPSPKRAFIVPTNGSGQIDQIQGSVVKEVGGVTVYICEPTIPSDIVPGCGMLPDHTGLHLTFKLCGKKSFQDEIEEIRKDIEYLKKAAMAD